MLLVRATASLLKKKDFLFLVLPTAYCVKNYCAEAVSTVSVCRKSVFCLSIHSFANQFYQLKTRASHKHV